jgi:sulfide:quinone oxidoreductase
VKRVVILGAGFAGQTAALYLGSALGRDHVITVVNRSDRFLFVPSLVWVGVGRMDPERTRFPLKPVYDRLGIEFFHGTATSVYPDEGFIVAEARGGGGPTRIDYDYLVIATGPGLDFEATPGLGPGAGLTHSICTAEHAAHARDAYLESVERLKRGEKQRLVIGAGHPGATCQGAAFEYITNIHKDLMRRGVRHKAQLTYLSNERAVGDFGVRGVHFRRKGEIVSSEDFLRWEFGNQGIDIEVQRGVTNIQPGRIEWQDFEGANGETRYDFAMLIPRFTGSPLRFIGYDGEDVSRKVVNANGFVIVDGEYGLPYEQLEHNPDAWPATYQNPTYKNIFAAGISFAPPGPISRPHVNPNGLSITAAAPRTGMVSSIIGRIVAKNIIDLVKHGTMTHAERMSEMFAACIASMGDSLWDGAAAVIVVYPIVPDMRRYPNEEGRDMFVTHMEMGLAGAWMKRMLHSTFMHKLQGRPFWRAIPE